MVFIRIDRKLTVAELLSQIPLEMSEEVSNWMGQYMMNRFRDNGYEDYLWFGFDRDCVMNNHLRGLGVGYMPSYDNSEHMSGGDWYLAEGYTQLGANPILTNYQKFQNKCKELGYTRVGHKKYVSTSGQTVTFKEQHVSGGTKPMWMMSWLNGEKIVYCGAAAVKIAGSLNATVRQSLTPLEDFLEGS